MNIPEEILSTLTDEQKKKVEAAQSPDELLAVAKEASYELSGDQLESVAGGKCKWYSSCPLCTNHQGCPSVCYMYYTCSIDCVKN